MQFDCVYGRYVPGNSRSRFLRLMVQSKCKFAIGEFETFFEAKGLLVCLQATNVYIEAEKSTFEGTTLVTKHCKVR